MVITLSPQFALGSPFGCPFCAFEQAYDDLYLPLSYCMEYFQHLKKPLCYSPLPSPPCPACVTLELVLRSIRVLAGQAVPRPRLGVAQDSVGSGEGECRLRL